MSSPTLQLEALMFLVELNSCSVSSPRLFTTETLFLAPRVFLHRELSLVGTVLRGIARLTPRPHAPSFVSSSHLLNCGFFLRGIT